MAFIDNVSKELKALQENTYVPFSSQYYEFDYYSPCDVDPKLACQEIKEILILIDKISLDGVWPTHEQWRDILPGLFVYSFLPDRQLAAQQSALDIDLQQQSLQAEYGIEWRLRDWLTCFKQYNRTFFVSHLYISSNKIHISIVSTVRSPDIKVLEWLVLCCGGEILQQLIATKAN